MDVAIFSAGAKQIDANQEMIALGMCNLLGSFVSSMPVTGSFSRTAVNCASGVKTPLGGLFTGALVILALAFLMPFCAYIPKASLAAVIITAVIFRCVLTLLLLNFYCFFLININLIKTGDTTAACHKKFQVMHSK